MREAQIYARHRTHGGVRACTLCMRVRIGLRVYESTFSLNMRVYACICVCVPENVEFSNANFSCINDVVLGEAFFCSSQIRQPHTRDPRPKKSSRVQS